MTATALPEEESFERRVDLALWRKLFGYAWRYRAQALGLMAAGAGTAGIDAFFPLVTKAVVDDLQAGTFDAPGRYGAIYAALTLGLSLCVLAFIWLGGRIRTAVSHDIRRDGFDSLQRLSFSFYDTRSVGWLMARMTSDCERLSNILAWGVLDAVWGLTIMVSVSAVMLFLDATLALCVLAVVPVLAWVSMSFQKRILGSARVVRKTNSKITAAYNEGIMGVRTTKVFAREEENLAEFRGLTSAMRTASVRNQILSASYLPIVLSLGSVAIALALAVGGIEVTAGGLSLGTLLAFMTYGRQFFEPIQELAHWFAELQMAQASAERIMGLIETEPEIRDSERVAARIEAGRAAVARELAPDGYPTRIGKIEFRGVSFEYEKGKPVLRDFDASVEAGQRIALVGATGGGKSTIVSLLCRFYEPTHGAILLDGVDYRERGLQWFQSQLGIVLQTPHLFTGSVRENIRYGRLDASDDEVEAAAELAGATGFIATLELGWDTDVGEGGSLLSVGQKQLVSFARAILKRPQILVMDEATSSVDTETERAIQAGLEHVLEERTSFVIAHRLSTIREADRILVIDRGELVEQGTHGELLARWGRYHALYTQQSLRESGVAASADR